MTSWWFASDFHQKVYPLARARIERELVSPLRKDEYYTPRGLKNIRLRPDSSIQEAFDSAFRNADVPEFDEDLKRRFADTWESFQSDGLHKVISPERIVGRFVWAHDIRTHENNAAMAYHVPWEELDISPVTFYRTGLEPVDWNKINWCHKLEQICNDIYRYVILELARQECQDNEETDSSFLMKLESTYATCRANL